MDTMAEPCALSFLRTYDNFDKLVFVTVYGSVVILRCVGVHVHYSLFMNDTEEQRKTAKRETSGHTTDRGRGKKGNVSQTKIIQII